MKRFCCQMFTDPWTSDYNENGKYHISAFRLGTFIQLNFLKRVYIFWLHGNSGFGTWQRIASLCSGTFEFLSFCWSCVRGIIHWKLK